MAEGGAPENFVALREKIDTLDTLRTTMCGRVNSFTREVIEQAQRPMTLGQPEDVACGHYLNMLDNRIMVCQHADQHLTQIFTPLMSSLTEQNPSGSLDNKGWSVGSLPTMTTADLMRSTNSLDEFQGHDQGHNRPMLVREMHQYAQELRETLLRDVKDLVHDILKSYIDSEQTRPDQATYLKQISQGVDGIGIDKDTNRPRRSTQSEDHQTEFKTPAGGTTGGITPQDQESVGGDPAMEAATTPRGAVEHVMVHQEAGMEGKREERMESQQNVLKQVGNKRENHTPAAREKSKSTVDEGKASATEETATSTFRGNSESRGSADFTARTHNGSPTRGNNCSPTSNTCGRTLSINGQVNTLKVKLNIEVTGPTTDQNDFLTLLKDTSTIVSQLIDSNIDQNGANRTSNDTASAVDQQTQTEPKLPMDYGHFSEGSLSESGRTSGHGDSGYQEQTGQTMRLNLNAVGSAYPASVIFHGVTTAQATITGLDTHLKFDDIFIMNTRWYNKDTGVFTVPRSGNYRMVFKARVRHTEPHGHTASSCSIKITSAQQGPVPEFPVLTMSSLWWDDNPRQVRFDETAALDEGDDIHLEASSSHGDWTTVAGQVAMMVIETSL